jgi:hypothetical protein
MLVIVYIFKEYFIDFIIFANNKAKILSIAREHESW